MKKYTLKNYVEYLKDNPKGYWFKRRLYGWGWFPAKWQGWVVVLAFIVLLILNGLLLSYKSENKSPSAEDLILFFAILVLLVIIMVCIAYKKGEKPKWSWGEL
jgi:hypothetical protein